MSDRYWPDPFDDPGLPLFSRRESTLTARKFHESKKAQRQALEALRSGAEITRREYERSAADGRRIAPVIEQLRNAYGFVIDGDGSVEKPYHMVDRMQYPSMAAVSDEMKATYYQTPHWLAVRHTRLAKDNWTCVLCGSGSQLRVHHITYESLFEEPLRHLITVCDTCHETIHASARLKFPSGVSVQYAHWLGWKEHEIWLLP